MCAAHFRNGEVVLPNSSVGIMCTSCDGWSSGRLWRLAGIGASETQLLMLAVGSSVVVTPRVVVAGDAVLNMKGHGVAWLF